ncbi:putative leucine-rich repeat domain superfamily [Helianthus annuus]|uniref:Leucine-rich repeat domain superfamily n=1 Tax=Helianthus annuus TaxID=4232 RepID=A0A251SGX4_HELAN|nr:putative leucine-rich repeat domain superfamily [Helianthus annuus]KAJ0465658.1 putative leucine-rich repeat domain superfamily [Helianthus annuus]KAJ0470532.1 putative leucine-rich repeat domain superfamily [Helianthus annuus]KAJ0487251.1 putative leucine-rich repeat domain superfamily [Helianthus annuus]KAJ0661363.1 putative leucine-rich repeat domain superfamily [Helianthus annuus]
MAHKVFIGDLTTNALMKFPVLEELNLYAIIISKEEIETVGRYCPMLKTLKVNSRGYAGSLMRYNEIAIAIGQNLLGIRHLELIGNKMTNVGLRVILDNCHHLETLDLRECFYIDLKGDLGKQCSKQIKYLKLPNDSLEGCPYLWIISKEDYQDSGDNNDGYDSYESY